MTETNYPEEIYSPVWGLNPHNPECMSITSAAIEKAYDLGRTHAADPLEGYTNVTQAIRQGVNIDYEKLDGRRVLFLNRNNDRVETALERNKSNPVDEPAGWSCLAFELLRQAWHGQNGWTLYADGEIPVKQMTARELEPGVYFKGTHDKCFIPYIVAMKGNGDAVHITYDMSQSRIPAPLWKVVEVLGTFEEDL